MQAGKCYYVELTFPEGYQIPPQTQVEARIKTSHPQFQLIRVPIRQQPAPVLASVQPKIAPVVHTNQPPPAPVPATATLGGQGGASEPSQSLPPLPPPSAAPLSIPQP